MEEDDKGCPMIRMGVSGWVLLQVPAYPGSPGPKAIKRLCVCVCVHSHMAYDGCLKPIYLSWADSPENQNTKRNVLWHSLNVIIVECDMKWQFFMRVKCGRIGISSTLQQQSDTVDMPLPGSHEQRWPTNRITSVDQLFQVAYHKQSYTHLSWQKKFTGRPNLKYFLQWQCLSIIQV